MLKIYEAADRLMKAGDWGLIDDLLMHYGLSSWQRELDFMMTWATVTNVCRKKLKNRKWFMEQCLIFHSDPNEPDLWKGLWEDDTDPIPFLKSIGLAGDVDE